MAKLLMIVSSARTIRLADGGNHPTGYRAEEVRKPLEAFVAAGIDVVIATPAYWDQNQLYRRLGVKRLDKVTITAG